MIALAIIGNAILGGVWRRVLGGWFSLRRSYIVAAGLLLTWPLFLALPWFYAIPAAIASVAYWTPGHRVDSDWRTLARYQVFGVGWIAARHLGVTPWTVVGEVVAGALFWGTVGGLGWGFK